MFDLPQAKRVRRAKLFSASSSSSASDVDEFSKETTETARIVSNTTGKVDKSTKHRRPELEGGQQPQDQDLELVDYGFEYDFIDTVPATSNEKILPTPIIAHNQALPDEITANEEQELEPTGQSYEFLLFKSTTKTSTTTDTPAKPKTIITIRSPTPETSTNLLGSGSGDITQPRPLKYYFTSHLSAETQLRLQSEYTSSAITAAQLQIYNQKPWPGVHLPWRIIHIPPSKLVLHSETTISSTKSLTSNPQDQPNPNPNKNPRPRPSKKRRIHLRQRIQARRDLLAKSKVDEEAEREKRTRRNREKKVKRKEREKRKKMGLGNTGSGDGGEEESEEEEEESRTAIIS